MNHLSIPTGWKEVKLGDVGKVSMCKRILKSQTATSGDIPFFKIGTFGREPDAFISEEVYRGYKQKYSFPKKGEILVSAAGTIGRLVIYDGRSAYYQDSNIVWLANNEKRLLNSFLFYAYKRVKWQTASGTIARLYNENIRGIIIPVPPLSEQHSIVAVLETWDKAIEKLERKIEVKKQIKTGLMQFLLKGKKRLPGFKGDWVKVKLHDIGKITSGGTPSKKIDSYWQGSIPWISSSDLCENNIKKVNIHRFISEDGKKNSTTNLIPRRSIIMVSRVGVGKLIINEVDLCTSQDFQSISPKENFDCYFLAYLLLIEIKALFGQNQGTSIKGFKKGDLEKLQLTIPRLKEEQVAIASILATADNEIETLQTKLRLLQEQKNYLLNNLIAGRMRLPEFL